MSESDLPESVTCCGFTLLKSEEPGYSGLAWNNTITPLQMVPVYKGVAGNFLRIEKNGVGWWKGSCEIPNVGKVSTFSTSHWASPEEAAQVLEGMVYDRLIVQDTLQQWFASEKLKREKP